MKVKVKIVCVILFTITWFIAGCSWKKRNHIEEDQPRLVSVFVVGEHHGVRYTYPAKVEPNEQVQLAFEVPGLLIKMNVKAGDLVKAGDVLAVLDPRDYEIDLSKAKANFEKAEADVNRNQPLAEKDYISKASFDEFVAKRDIAKADLEAVEKRLSDTHLVAPFSGIIAQDPIDNFQNVQAKQPIMLLYKPELIKIALNVPSADMMFKKEKPSCAKVTIEDLPDREFEAAVRSFSPLADPETQTYRVVLTMKPLADVNILPGMAATVTAGSLVDNEELRGTYFSLPSSAVLSDEKGNPFVWIVDPETMEVRKNLIKAGEFMDNVLLVLEGLKKGEVVVNAGGSYLQEGMKVRTENSI